ncbi:MAG TPA: pyrroline-5-carboxylate reductase [Chloroflexota bacterium]|jgi:pyrroline-5-carboxylate reductase
MRELPTIAFLGAGQMAEAVIRGLLAAGAAPPERLYASDIRPERLDYLASQLNVCTCANNRDALDRAEVAVIAVKPQDAPTLLADMQLGTHPGHLVISVAAGVKLASLEDALPDEVPIIRVMPNTPAFVSEGMAVIARGRHATEDHESVARRIFESVGRVLVLPESKMDAVTALSGSGPGFVALMIEGLADGGVAAGLPRDTALMLAAQTVLGTARLALERNLHPAIIKDMVASPAGTTIAGLTALEEGGVRGALINAVLAATRRSEELGRLA